MSEDVQILLFVPVSTLETPAKRPASPAAETSAKQPRIDDPDVSGDFVSEFK